MVTTSVTGRKNGNVIMYFLGHSDTSVNLGATADKLLNQTVGPTRQIACSLLYISRRHHVVTRTLASSFDMWIMNCSFMNMILQKVIIIPSSSLWGYTKMVYCIFIQFKRNQISAILYSLWLCNKHNYDIKIIFGHAMRQPVSIIYDFLGYVL